MDQHVKVAIGLGANLGDRAHTIARATKRLAEEFLEEMKVSSLYESEPLPLPGKKPASQPLFLNAVVTGMSVWKPPAIVNYLKRLEAELGRQAREYYGPREIDLDLLLFGDVVFRAEGVNVPHPGVSQRDFVLLPLLEVWPSATLPPTGMPLKQAWAGLQDSELVTARRIGPIPQDTKTR